MLHRFQTFHKKGYSDKPDSLFVYIHTIRTFVFNEYYLLLLRKIENFLSIITTYLSKKYKIFCNWINSNRCCHQNPSDHQMHRNHLPLPAAFLLLPS